jgi:hypothetical protein
VEISEEDEELQRADADATGWFGQRAYLDGANFVCLRTDIVDEDEAESFMHAHDEGGGCYRIDTHWWEDEGEKDDNASSESCWSDVGEAWASVAGARDFWSAFRIFFPLEFDCSLWFLPSA